MAKAWFGVVTRRYYQYGGLVTLLPCPRPSDQRTVWCNSGWILCCLFHLVLLLDDNSAEHCKSCCHVCVLLLENTLLARGGAVSLECREACFILRNHHQILCSRTFDFMAWFRTLSRVSYLFLAGGTFGIYINAIPLSTAGLIFMYSKSPI
jgi:hypothetical protein